eukprot:TRINITY_DN21909_c0_g1_i1.p1 TRINITY_DN21909_c0_g1~~TRINITY_DN21909_c0_g1_i1.p1  ORF type:complete len:697 (+),score=140.25 TRINITY_DN21909_c0_g1_i1:69-2159(+)
MFRLEPAPPAGSGDAASGPGLVSVEVRQGDSVCLGRGDTLGVWDAAVSRRHCELRAQEPCTGFPATLAVKRLGANAVVVLPFGDAGKGRIIRSVGGEALLTHGDGLCLLPNGAYVFRVVWVPAAPAAAEPAPEAPAASDNEDTDGEAGPDGSDSPRRSFRFTRVPSGAAAVKLIEDDEDDGAADDPAAPAPVPPPVAATPAPPAGAMPAGPDGGPPDAKRPRTDTSGPAGIAPPVVSGLDVPLCKYGAGCTRRNPAHLREFWHPAEVVAAAARPPAPAPPPPAGALPPCKYGAGCTRRNPAHFAAFSHPPRDPSGVPPAPSSPTPAAPAATPALDVTDPKLRAERAIASIIPKQYMPEDEFVEVSGGHGKYKMKYTAGTYYCTCVAWRYQSGAVDSRTCKHLKEYLGDDFEAARCRGAAGGAAGSPGTPSPKAKKYALKGVLLADKYDPGKHDPTGWWVSEKLDGVRAYWDGTRFLSRNGNEFTAPPHFTSGLPKHPVDGELFGGRGMFQSTVSIVKSSAAHKGWDGLTYEVFDIPDFSGPWEARLAEMKRLFPPGRSKFVHLVEQNRCEGPAQLERYMDTIIGLKGEGAMLRQPGSHYIRSRSSTLLKVKRFVDTEAIVRAHDAGKGKNTGQLGALVCELRNGKRFNVGTGFTDAMRRKPPKVGAIITVKYQELTVGGVPRFPVFVGERCDVSWP